MAIKTRQIFLNGEDYGMYNESELKNNCANWLFNNIKKIHNSIDDLELEQEYKTFISNATKIDFIDIIPTEGDTDTIYVEIDVTKFIYLYINNLMNKVRIEQEEGGDKDITNEVLDNAWNKANLTFDSNYSHKVIQNDIETKYNVRCIKTISDKQAEPRKILEIADVVEGERIIQVDYTTKDGQITCMEEKEKYFNPESPDYINPNKYNETTMHCVSIEVDEDGFATQTYNKDTKEYNWKYENGIRIPMCATDQVILNTTEKKQLYKLHFPLTMKETYQFNELEFESGSDHTQGTKEYYLENSSDLYKKTGDNWERKFFENVGTLPTPSRDINKNYYICDSKLYQCEKMVDESKWYVDTIEAKINTEYLYYYELKAKRVKTNNQGVIGTYQVTNTTEGCLDARGYDGNYSFNPTNFIETSGSTKGVVEGNSVYIDGGITLKDFLFKNEV